MVRGETVFETGRPDVTLEEITLAARGGVQDIWPIPPLAWHWRVSSCDRRKEFVRNVGRREGDHLQRKKM